MFFSEKVEAENRQGKFHQHTVRQTAVHIWDMSGLQSTLLQIPCIESSFLQWLYQTMKIYNCELPCLDILLNPVKLLVTLQRIDDGII